MAWTWHYQRAGQLVPEKAPSHIGTPSPPASLSWAGGSSSASCFLQRLCPGTPFPGQEKQWNPEKRQEPKLPKFCLQKRRAQAWVFLLITSSEKGCWVWASKSGRKMFKPSDLLAHCDGAVQMKSPETPVESHQLHLHTPPTKAHCTPTVLAM